MQAIRARGTIGDMVGAVIEGTPVVPIGATVTVGATVTIRVTGCFNAGGGL